MNRGGAPVPLVDFVTSTHTRKNTDQVSARARRVVAEVQSKMNETLSQRTESSRVEGVGETTGTQLTPEQQDQIYMEV